MSLIRVRTIKLDVSELVEEIRKLRMAVEGVLQLDKPVAQPYVDFDPDDYSSVLYSDETKELVQQHLDKRVAGIDVGF